MADLTSYFVGIKSPNPFWLASAPPTDKAYNVNRAFEAGWAVRCGKHWAKTRRSSTLMARVTARFTATSAGSLASTTSS